MLRGFIIVVVALYSRVFLKMRIFRHQVLGVVLTVIGTALVGLATILYSSSGENSILGIFLIIIAQFVAGGLYVSEQLFFEHINIDPLQAVGIEGASGFLYCLIMLPILNFIPCNNKYFFRDG